MNTISNNKILLLTAVGTLMINGCVSKNSFQKSSFVQPKNIVKKSNTWKSIKQDRDDCPDCYASGISAKKSVEVTTFEPKEESVSYNYSNIPANLEESYVEYKAKVSKPSYVDNVIDTQNYGAYDYTVAPTDTYMETQNIKVTPKLSYLNSSRDSFNTKLTSDTTIQVGAFRHYSGAEKTANKYSLLSSQYIVKIETGTKDGLPIHRVRISGFHSKGQAKAFMQKYAINDAFLVIR